MEETKSKTKKIMAIIFVIIVILIITMLSLGVYQKNNELAEKEIKNNELSQQMLNTNVVLKNQTLRADSMNKILVSIAKYMPMASTLQYRDSVCSKLPYKPGDVVRMKPDSSKWVIIAVSVTGGKWQHKISYLVRDSSRKEISVEPETIY